MAQQGLERIPYAVGPDFRMEPVRARFPEQGGSAVSLVPDSFIPDAAPEPKPVASEDPGYTGDIWRGLKYGAQVQLPKMAGQALQFFGAESTGKSMVDAAEARATPDMQESAAGQAEKSPYSVRGNVYEAATNAVPSLAPGAAGAAAGAAVGSVVPGVGTALGALAGYALGSVAALPMFYGSQAKESYDAVKANQLQQGKSESEADAIARRTAHAEGAIEAGGELVADVIPFAKLFKPFAKPVGNAIVKSALVPTVKGAVKTVGGVVAAEVGTEMAQQAGQNAVRKSMGGTGPGATWEETQKVIMPTTLMSVIPGMAGAGAKHVQQSAALRALMSPDTDPETRSKIAMGAAEAIKAGSPEVSKAFAAYAAEQIAARAPIEIADDAFYASAAGPRPVEGTFIPADRGGPPAGPDATGGATYTQEQAPKAFARPALPAPSPLDGDVLGPQALPAGQAMLPPGSIDSTATEIKDAAPAPTLRQQATSRGLLNHSARPSPDMLKRLMRIDDGMAQRLYDEWAAAQTGPKEAEPASSASSANLRQESGIPEVSPLEVQAHAAATSPFNQRPQPTDAQKKAGPASFGKVGPAPGAARTISLQDNGDGTATVMAGDEPFYDFDSGDPVRVPADAKPSAVKQAIIDAGAVTSKDRWFGVNDGETLTKPASEVDKAKPAEDLAAMFDDVLAEETGKADSPSQNSTYSEPRKNQQPPAATETAGTAGAQQSGQPAASVEQNAKSETQASLPSTGDTQATATIAGKPVADMSNEQLQKIASGESKTFGSAAVEKASAELARRDEADSPKATKEPWQYGELEYGDKYIDETVLPDLRKQLANAHGGKFQEYPSKAAAVRGLKERIDTLENHRDAKARKYYASLDNHYGAVRAALADGKPVPPVAYESYDDLKGDVSAGRIKGDGQEVARVETPQHIEAGQAEPATAPVIAASIKESATNTPMNIEQAREWLLSEIDKAIIDAKSAKEEGIWNRADDKVNLEGIMDVGATIGFKTFNVPGDGKFRVLNLKESLQKFKKQVAATPGFKKNATRPMSLANGSGGKTSVRDMLDDGEYVLAVDYGHLTGKPLLFGAAIGNNAHPVAYTDAEPVDIGGVDAQVGREWNQTGKAFSWRVIETTTGAMISSESTKEKAISKVLAKLDEHGVKKLIDIIKETPKVSQAELERQFTDWGSEEEARAQKQRDALERVDTEDRALWNSIWPLKDGEKRSPNPWNDIDHLQVAILAKDADKAGKGDEFVSLIERRRGGTNNVLALAARKALADAAPKAKPSKGAVTTGVASKILGDIYQRAAYNKWTWDRLKSYLTRELEEAGVGKSRMANALEKAMTEYARTANGRLGYPNSNLVFSAMRDYGLITEDAPDAQQKPGVDYKGFERTPTGNGSFTLKDGNLLVKVEAMGQGKFQASHGSAKSSPHINSEQGAVDWAANYRGDGQTEGNTEDAGVDKASDPIEIHADLMARLREGTATLNEFKAGFAAVVDGKTVITESLSKLTKDAIFERFPGLAYRYKNDKKADVVDAAYSSMLNSFAYVVSDGIQWTYGQKYEDVIRGYVDRATEAELRKYADDQKAAKEDREARQREADAGMDNPVTLDDYKRILSAKAREIGEGATFAQARMAMTPEQRARFDELAGEASREQRQARADQQRTEVRVAAQTTEGQIVETKHTKTGEPLFVVKAADRVEREVYNQWNAQAKKLGGWYSKFRGGGAVPGFQFKTRDNADAFLKYLGGDVAPAKEAMQARRDAFADDRTQSAAERLEEMAAGLDGRADESLSVERKANTERRARMAAGAEAAAQQNKAMARTMRNIADKLRNGSAKFLDRVRQKVQVEMLDGFVTTAKDKELSAKYDGYAEQEKHRFEPATAETADYSEFPAYTFYRSDLASLGRQMLEHDGTKKLGAAVMRIADDVSAAYTKFAKENFHKVALAKSGGGLAAFPSRDAAEAAIRRSGFKGKAIVLPIKRGENAVVMSPSEASERGIWTGDPDKRLTLPAELGDEVAAKTKELGRLRIAVPWMFERTAEQRKRLKAIGIETPAEFRAALREFIAAKSNVEPPSRIKELERKMIGRKNDGLDFFPTPAGVAQRMVESADIQEGMAVLEPSAGMGHIAEAIREAGVDPDVMELSGDRRELLDAKGFNVIGSDFMDISPRGYTYGDVFRHKDGRLGVMRGTGGMGSNRVGFVPEGYETREWVDREDLTGERKAGANSGYDRILMNPPFSERRDAEHVQHAYTLLRPGGRIVAIMGEGVFFGQDKKAQAFRDWLDEVGGTSEKLEDGTFLDPSLPVNTGANARLVVIDKGRSSDAVMFNAKSGPRGNPLDAAALEATIGRVISGSPSHFSRDTVVTAPLFADLPAPILAKAKKEGYDANGRKPNGEKLTGATYDGKVYLVQENISSELEAEETLLHERVHQIVHGNAKDKNGIALRQSLGRLYLRLGAKSGIERMAKEAGVDISGPLAAFPNVSAANRHAFLAEELLAHAEGQRAYERLPAKIKRAAQEFWGEFRDWLRTSKFVRIAEALGAKLSNFTQSDLAWTLKGVRQQEAGAGSKAIRFMTAWHGSPHDHDRFDLSKIGTGEGGQAYGWGLYFAGSRDVAEFYREKLASGYSLRGKKNYEHSTEEINAVIKIGRLLAQGSQESMAINLVKAEAKRDVDNAKKLLDERTQNLGKEIDTGEGWGDLRYQTITQADVDASADGYERAQKRLEVIEGINVGDVAPNKGRLYKVDLAPAEDEYLLWDSPLSEQSDKVKAALKSLIDEQTSIEEGDSPLWKMSWSMKSSPEFVIGRQIYTVLAYQDGQKAASEYLLSIGIRGIKYLDGNSRNRPLKEIKAEFLAELPEDADADEVLDLVGTGQFSPKNEALIKALAEDDWLGFYYPSQAISTALSNGLSNYDASPALLKAVSDAKDGGSFNYVIFNDADVSITAKESRAAQASTGTAGRLAITQAKSIVAKFVDEFKRAADLDIRIVASPEEIPTRYRPSRYAEGVYHSDIGTIWLVTDNLMRGGRLNASRTFQVLLHEAVGHYGMSVMMGDKFKSLKARVLATAKAKGPVVDDYYKPGDEDYATVEAVRLRYPDATDDQVADEVLARMAETDPGRTLFGYVRAVVRQWLRDVARKLGIQWDTTVAELNDLVALASAYMRRGAIHGSDTMQRSELRGAFESLYTRSNDGSLSAATADEKSGMSPLEIWRRHGWLNYSGQWRRAIPTNKVELFGGRVTNDAKRLFKTIHFPELQSLYPELESITVVLGEVDGTADAVFDVEKNRITISRKIKERDHLKKLIHEVQHAVQELDMRESGASHDGTIGSFMDYYMNEGEIEARDAEETASLSQAELRARTPALLDENTIAALAMRNEAADGSVSVVEKSILPSVISAPSALSAIQGLPVLPEISEEFDDQLVASVVNHGGDLITYFKSIGIDVKSVSVKQQTKWMPESKPIDANAYNINGVTEYTTREWSTRRVLNALTKFDPKPVEVGVVVINLEVDKKCAIKYESVLQAAGFDAFSGDVGSVSIKIGYRPGRPSWDLKGEIPTLESVVKANRKITKKLSDSRNVLGAADMSGERAPSGVVAASLADAGLESRARPGSNEAIWDAPDPTTADNVIYTLQDKHIDLKRVQAAIKDAIGQELPDQIDPYLQEELFHGRAAKATEEFLDRELQPLIGEMKQRGIGMDSLETYLWARHAGERNAQIAKINPDMPDGGSGLTDKQARDVLAGKDVTVGGQTVKGIEPAKLRGHAELARKIDMMVAGNRLLLELYELETPSTLAAWKGAYQHYVPLHREDVDSPWAGPGTGQGYSVRGASTKRATGSYRPVENILANLVMQRKRIITRGEKNRVAQALYGLATVMENRDFWKVDDVPKTRVPKEMAIYHVMDGDTEVANYTRMSEADKHAAKIPGGYVYQSWGERVVEQDDPMFRSRPNVVWARFGGEDRFVIFNERDERAMRLAGALKNLDADDISHFLGEVSRWTRYFASINTQYNPVFGVVNLTRDTGTGLLNLKSTPLEGKQAEMLGHVWQALPAIYRAIRIDRKGGTPTGTWAELWEEFQEAGGQTGYRDMFRNATEQRDALEAALDPKWWQRKTWGKVISAGGLLAPAEQALLEKAGKPVLDWLSDYNTTMENAIRLSAYKVARDQGMSRERAASLAKNLTVNFNRKGQAARQLGALYAFFNASVQGTARMLETLTHGRKPGKALGRAGKQIVYGGLLLGSMQAMWLAAAGFDDDEPPEFVRDRAIIIPYVPAPIAGAAAGAIPGALFGPVGIAVGATIGAAIGEVFRTKDGKPYAAVPLPLGFHVLPALGRIGTEQVLNGFKAPGRAAFHVLDVMADAFNPIGNAGMSMQTLAPTVLDPAAALAENKDWTGKQIYRENFSQLDPKPGHQRTKDTATALSKWLSQALNSLTGGTEFQPGGLSPTPDQIDYLIGQVTGGVGREVSKLAQTGGAMATGEELPAYKIPLIGRFYGDAKGQAAVSSRFYKALKTINMHQAEFMGLAKSDRGEQAKAYLEGHPEASMFREADRMQRYVGKLQDEKRKAIADRMPSAKVKEIDAKITEAMQGFNARVASRRVPAVPAQ